MVAFCIHDTHKKVSRETNKVSTSSQVQKIKFTHDDTIRWHWTFLFCLLKFTCKQEYNIGSWLLQRKYRLKIRQLVRKAGSLRSFLGCIFFVTLGNRFWRYHRVLSNYFNWELHQTIQLSVFHIPTCKREISLLVFLWDMSVL